MRGANRMKYKKIGSERMERAEEFSVVVDTYVWERLQKEVQ